MTTNAFTEGLNTLMQWQHQYLENLKSLSSGSASQTAPNPWSSLFNGFANTAGKPATGSDPFSLQLHQQINMMTQLSRGFTEAMETALSAAQKNGEQWQTAVNQSLDEMQTSYRSFQSPPFTPAMNFTGQGHQPWTAWQQFFDPAAANNFTNPWTATNPMSGLLGALPTMPGLGPDREKLEKLQQLQSLGQGYMTALLKFTEQYRDFWPRVIERLKVKIQETVQPGNDTPVSARVLYNLWIDGAEEEYAAITGQDSYQQSYGEMINAMMALRKAGTDLQDDLLQTMNIPTMRELDSLSERLQRTRRENRALRTELSALRAEVDTIHKASATDINSTAATATKAKTSTRKRPATARKRTARKATTTKTK